MQFVLGFSLVMWPDQPGSRLLAGSTRQKTVGRINQVADCGVGDEDEDEDEIPSYAVLITASVKILDVSRMQCFFFFFAGTQNS